MAKKRKTKTSRTPSTNGKSKPVSFRLTHPLIGRLDHSAARVGVTRNHLVALVLHEYINARGDIEVDRIVGEAAANERQINLFD